MAIGASALMQRWESEMGGMVFLFSLIFLKFAEFFIFPQKMLGGYMVFGERKAPAGIRARNHKNDDFLIFQKLKLKVTSPM